EALDVELPEESDGVHAVEAQPDWSQAPGGEVTFAPGDLGEGGPPVESAPARAPGEAVQGYAPPPPPPPPLEADGAPVAPIAPTVPASAGPAAGSAIPRDAEPAPAPAPMIVEQEPARTSAASVPSAAGEPPAPAAVAAPAPRELGPDEQAELAAIDAQIAEVEAKIARDEEAMLELISATEGEGAPQGSLVDDARFRDLAQRLPRLQADLERLRERRAQIQPVVPRP